MMPIDYKQYPMNWKTEVRPRILKRADDKCEWCFVANKALGARDLMGGWWSSTPIAHLSRTECYNHFGVNYPKLIRIVLTIAHIQDRDPMNVDDSNLAALCQRCHLNHDRDQHNENRRYNRLKRIEEKRQANGERRLFE